MSHVSKNQLEEKVFLRIYDQFANAVSSQAYKKEGVLGDLLTKTEKIMFAKRLAVIFMLLEDASFYHIYESLHVAHLLHGGFVISYIMVITHISRNFFIQKRKRRISGRRLKLLYAPECHLWVGGDGSGSTT